jgi:hypothetical protein
MKLYDVEQSAQQGIADAGHIGAHNKIKHDKKGYKSVGFFGCLIIRKEKNV